MRRSSATINRAEVKLVKLERELVSHHHEAEDEMFLVMSGSGRSRLRLCDGDVSAP